MTVIDRLPNTGELLLEKIASYLNEDIPVIVENATKSWPNRGIINAMDLKKVSAVSQEKWSWVFRPGPTQTSIYSQRRRQDAGSSGFKKKDCTV